jgi:hypothetical protein
MYLLQNEGNIFPCFQKFQTSPNLKAHNPKARSQVSLTTILRQTSSKSNLSEFQKPKPKYNLPSLDITLPCSQKTHFTSLKLLVRNLPSNLKTILENHTHLHQSTKDQYQFQTNPKIEEEIQVWEKMGVWYKIRKTAQVAHDHNWFCRYRKKGILW